ncbi:MAG: 3'(2'),5'-bisphosphate nucleotidase CysQ [Elioraea sp.]|nr:3'(2'),5'-bisphosphate nucleotidase CysQ [Elioraea sp.]MDW8445419.1 3'(2'),5'-bisphosphate nucleotidase CysQ [Acetobacteraceae bacterium]
MTDEERVELAARLAREASAVILAARRAGITVAAKGDLSPVTEADQAAERLIVSALRTEDPLVAVIAEEEVSAGRIGPRGDAYWLIDPLDGTREFAQGGDEFAICLGFVRAGRPVLGAVALPASGELFCGRVGHGAWKEDGEGRRPIATRAPPEEGLTVFASRHHAEDPRLARFVAGLPVARLIHAGSALKFCRVAEGSADLYPRFGRTMEWDTAGPQAIVEAAGGSVTTLDGAPLAYGKRGFVNPDFVCRGRP